MKRDLPLVGERFPGVFGTHRDGHDLDALNLVQRLHVNDAHGAGPGESDLHADLLTHSGFGLQALGFGPGPKPGAWSRAPDPAHSSTSRVGFVTAIVRTSSTEKPASSSRCA